MDEQKLLIWLYADIDEIIDFEGYTTLGDFEYERKQSFEDGTYNGGEIRHDIG